LHLAIWQLKFTAVWPMPVKMALSIGVSGLLVAATYVPIRNAWREERAAALSGELEPPSSKILFEDSDVQFQIGLEGDATRFKCTEGTSPNLSQLGRSEMKFVQVGSCGMVSWGAVV
jgi:hypothetical protein